jgi:hypothetical protein
MSEPDELPGWALLGLFLITCALAIVFWVGVLSILETIWEWVE